LAVADASHGVPFFMLLEASNASACAVNAASSSCRGLSRVATYSSDPNRGDPSVEAAFHLISDALRFSYNPREVLQALEALLAVAGAGAPGFELAQDELFPDALDLQPV
jgi:hypothetical protein